MIRKALILCVLCAALMGCSARSAICEGADFALPVVGVNEFQMCKERVSSSDAMLNRKETEVACPGCPPEYLTRHNSTD